MKSYIDKAKNLDKFKEKDVEFKAYFDNLDQIKNETSKLQANTAETLNVINKLIDEGENKLKVIDMFNLFLFNFRKNHFKLFLYFKVIYLRFDQLE